ncbi:DUF1003 domain-containing protein [Alteromonas sediminis]|nr:DUF1003 domain-containing protein [Alteromonas sediminis]
MLVWMGINAFLLASDTAFDPYPFIAGCITSANYYDVAK